MTRKLFIVDPGNERLYRSLANALANELNVEVFYDRRRDRALRPPGIVERRAASEVAERIRRDGFAVVRQTPPAPKQGIVRWSA